MTTGIGQNEDPRDSWRKYGMRNLDQWIDYLDGRAADAAVSDKNNLYVLNDVINGISSLFNRMAQIHYATPKSLGIKEKIIPWLSHAANLPDLIAYALWYNLRNPVSHTGSWSPFLSLTKWNDRPVTTDIMLNAPDYLPAAPDPAIEEHILVWPDTFPVPGISRGLGWMSRVEVLEEEGDLRLELYGIEAGGVLEHVTFHIDELLQLARHARRVTESDLDLIPEWRLPGLEKLGLQIGFGLTADEWNDTKAAVEARRAEYLAERALVMSQDVVPAPSPDNRPSQLD